MYLRFEFEPDHDSNWQEGWYVDDVHVDAVARLELPPALYVALPDPQSYLGSPSFTVGLASDPNGDFDLDALELVLDDGSPVWPVLDEFWDHTFVGVATGPHVLTATLQDHGGLAVERPVSFRVDAEDPLIELDGDIGSAPVDCYVPIQGTATDPGGSGIYAIELFAEDRLVGAEYYEQETTELDWTVNASFAGFAPGEIALHARAIDWAFLRDDPYGNDNATPPIMVELGADCVARTTVLSPENGDVVRGRTTIEARTELPEGVEQAYISIAIDDFLVGDLYVEASGNWSWEVWSNYVGDGPHDINITTCLGGWEDDCTRTTVHVIVDNSQEFEFDGRIGCAAAHGLVRVEDACGGTTRFGVPVSPGPFFLRVTLQWDGPPTFEAGWLEVVVTLGEETWSQYGSGEVTLNGYAQGLGATEILSIEVRPYGGPYLPAVAVDQPFHQDGNLSYGW